MANGFDVAKGMFKDLESTLTGMMAKHPIAEGAGMRYAKGIGLHAAAGAVVGGGYAGAKGDNVTAGAWRGAKMGALVGLGGSAFRNRSNLRTIGSEGIAGFKSARAKRTFIGPHYPGQVF